MPTPVPTPIRPVVDLNGRNSDGSTGQDSPFANGINYQTVYPEGGGPQVIAPPAIVLSDISIKDPIDPNQIGKQLVEARVRIAPFPDDPDPRAPDNRPIRTGLNRNDIEVLDLPKGVRDYLGGKGRPASGLSFAYDNASQTFKITGGTAPDFVFNKLDFIRESYEIALSNITYENKFFRGSTDRDLNRSPDLRNRFITYVVDTDNDDTNNIDSRFVSQEPGNPKQSKPAVATLLFGDRQSLVVTTLADPTDDVAAARDGANSLREAMNFANTDGKDSAITFAPGLVSDTAPGTISLQRGLPFLQERNQTGNDPLPIIKTSITGPGPRLLTIQANGNATFNTFKDSLAVSGLSITNAGGSGISTFGGDLTVDRCIVKGNSSNGVQSITDNNVSSQVAATLTVTNSSISGNSGYGIYTSNNRTPNKTTTITNTTVSGNTDGIFVDSHIINATQAQKADPTTISLSTIANNSSVGIDASRNAVININDTISSGNRGSDVNGGGGGGNGGADVDGIFVTQKGNLVGTGNATAQFTDATDQIGVDPLLGPLANNGGDSDTHRLAAGSPAREKGVAPTGTAPTTDQRGTGFPRVVGTIDIGAYEAQASNPSFTVRITPRNPDQFTLLTANATGTNDDGTPITPLVYRWLINGIEKQTNDNAPNNPAQLNLNRFALNDG